MQITSQLSAVPLNTARKSVRDRYRGREEFSGEVEEIIDSITVYDRRLYQYAKGLGKR